VTSCSPDLGCSVGLTGVSRDFNSLLLNRVYETDGVRQAVRPSVCLVSWIDSSNSARRVCCCPKISIDSCGRVAGAVLQASALSSKCGQRHSDSRRRRLNTDLFYKLLGGVVGKLLRCTQAPTLHKRILRFYFHIVNFNLPQNAENEPLGVRRPLDILYSLQ